MKSLLYIEDDVSNAALIKRIVRHRPNWAMRLAETGADGLGIARKNPPDLILLDLNLPDMNGLDVLRLLRNDDKNVTTPVVVVSVDTYRADIARLLAAGADAYLTKPIKIADILLLLDSPTKDHLSPETDHI